jgi:hypothetical protein
LNSESNVTSVLVESEEGVFDSEKDEEWFIESIEA